MRGFRKKNLSGKTISTTMFLCTADSPDARRHGLYAGKQTGQPFLFDSLSFLVGIRSEYGAMDSEGDVADTEHYTAGLKVINADLNRAHARYFIVIRVAFPEGISQGRSLCPGVIYFKGLAKLVFCPETVAQGIRDSIMAQDDYHSAVGFRRTLTGIAHQKYLVPCQK